MQQTGAGIILEKMQQWFNLYRKQYKKEYHDD